jgi:MYXO-CTERM domain-containing protein
VVTVAIVAVAQVASASTVFLDTSTQVVQIGSDPSGLNNSVPLVNHAGPVTVTASGDASFGSLPGEVYNSALVAYRDHSGLAQYASVPMNSPSGVVIDGSRYDYALLTDNAGAHVGNTGTANISEMALSTALAGGTIYAGSTTSAQTGVAQLSSANAAFFNTQPVGVPQMFRVSVFGEAFYGPGANDKFGSIVVQYRDAGNGITYDSLPIGATRDYFGFNFRVYLTDFATDVGDNHGVLEATAVVVPEPGMGMAALAILGGALVRRRRWVCR